MFMNDLISRDICYLHQNELFKYSIRIQMKNDFLIQNYICESQ